MGQAAQLLGTTLLHINNPEQFKLATIIAVQMIHSIPWLEVGCLAASGRLATLSDPCRFLYIQYIQFDLFLFLLNLDLCF